MGKRTVTYSDLSGKELDDPKDTATMTIEFHDKRRGAYCLDITKDEAESFAAKGSKAAAE